MAQSDANGLKNFPLKKNSPDKWGEINFIKIFKNAPCVNYVIGQIGGMGQIS